MRRIILIALTGILGLIAVIGMYWRFGSPLSEETSFKLASDMAKQNGYNLDLYTPPVIGAQEGSAIYEFVWVSKKGGKPINIVVDPKSVEVYEVKDKMAK